MKQRRDKVQVDISALEGEFLKIVATAPPPMPVVNDLDDLGYKFYRDSWTKLPDFSALKHEEEGKLPRNLFDLSPRTRDEAFGFVFEGTLIVPQAGPYTFFLDSDDGSRLTVAGKVVLEYDGIHEVGKEKKATVQLPQGRLSVRLEYFQNVSWTGDSRWPGPVFGFARRSLSAAAQAASIDLAGLIAREGAALLGKERMAEYKRLKKTLASLELRTPAWTWPCASRNPVPTPPLPMFWSAAIPMSRETRSSPVFHR